MEDLEIDSAGEHSLEETKAERRRRREAQRMVDTRPLEPWERYRALADLVDHMVEIVELADRRTRFALLILGALNGVNLLVAVRADSLGIQGLGLTFIMAYVTCYVLLSLYFFTYAIVALKPRLHQPAHGASTGSPRGSLRLVDDVLRQSPEEFHQRWNEVQVGELNREMAFHVHLLARTNAAKYRALGRVYFGLVILVVLTAVLIAVVGVRAVGAGIV
jgi:hypothetical protein